jgi:hypothetical protein
MPDIFTSAASKNGETHSKLKVKKVLYKDMPMQERRPLASFLMRPNGVSFETREEEEQIILFLRKHFVTNIPWIFTSMVLFLAPTVITQINILDSIPSNFKFVFIMIWYLISMAYTLESFLTWFFNVYIITDERIVDVDFYNLTYKEVSDANLDKIEDVTYKMGGVIRTLFNYGDVLIQTAAEVTNFDFLAVPYPDKVVKVLQDLRMEEQQEAIEGRVR